MSAAPFHLYIHWPWCKAKCPYCDFNSHAIGPQGLSHQQRQNYIAKIIEEITWWCTQVSPNRPLQSLFFGGGTPSLMEPAEIASIISAAQRLGTWQPQTEVTLECNPTSLGEDLGERYFHEIQQVGVNRISLGVQGLQDDWLHFLGRTHSSANALASLHAAQKTFQRVNADVIYGLPGQSLPEWAELLNQLAAMGLSHISAYQLTIERQTAFWGQVRKGQWQPIDSDKEADFFDLTRQVLGAAGYENYEISNFAKPGEACRHNLGVWRSEDYLGVGAGAHGRITLADGSRIATATKKLPEAYMASNPGESKHFATWEALNAARCVQEALFSGLRLHEGVNITRLIKTYGEGVWSSAVKTAEFHDFAHEGWMQELNTPTGIRWRLTTSGWSRLNALLERLLPSLSEPAERIQVRIQDL